MWRESDKTPSGGVRTRRGTDTMPSGRGGTHRGLTLGSRRSMTLLLCVICALAAGLWSLCAGAENLSPGVILSALRGQVTGTAYNIIWYVRLPRTLAGLLCGASLAAGGVLIQSVLGNPLAGPNVIGVNSGAGLGAVLCAAFFPGNVGAVPIAAFTGAMGAAFLVYGLARKTGASRLTLVLAGIAVGSILSALIDAVSILFPDAVPGSAAFLAGRLSGVPMKALRVPAILFILSLCGAWGLSDGLDLLSLGDETAQSLGLSVARVRYLSLTLAAVLCGAAVSFAGLVGFVGLLVPHAARFFIGREHRYLLPAAALTGAALVTVCDTLARILFAPFQLPVGILLSLMGGPFFLWLLFRQRGGRRT